VNRAQISGQSFLSERQGIFSFLLLMILCFSFYAMGLYVGRWSSAPPASAANNEMRSPEVTQASILPAATAEATAPPTAPENASELSLPPAAEKYAVQVATAGTQTEADEILERLRRVGFESVHAIAPEPNSVAQFFAVRVGPYDLETARQVAAELQTEHGFKSVQVMPRPVE
jgi:cell division septation protein DedD